MAFSSPSQESEMTTSALVVVQGLATGSLLYVVFFEILEKERQKEVSGLLQVHTKSYQSFKHYEAGWSCNTWIHLYGIAWTGGGKI